MIAQKKINRLCFFVFAVELNQIFLLNQEVIYFLEVAFYFKSSDFVA